MLSLNEDEYLEKDDKDMDYDGLLDCVRPTFLIPECSICESQERCPGDRWLIV